MESLGKKTIESIFSGDLQQNSSISCQFCMAVDVAKVWIFASKFGDGCHLGHGEKYSSNQYLGL